MHRPSKILWLTICLIAVAFAAAAVFGSLRAARALPPAGTDTLGVIGEITIGSRLGTETIGLQGTVTIRRDEPQLVGGIEVVTAEILSLGLEGQSLTGPVSVSQSETFASLGEIRSLQPPPDQFPASSFFDVFIDVAAPASPSDSLTLHNEEPLHLVPTSDGVEVPVDTWPPLGVTYVAEPGAPAESHCALPDEPGGLPLLPSLPAEICVTRVAIVLGEPTVPTPSTPTSLTATPPTETPPTEMPHTETPPPATPTVTATTMATASPSPEATPTPTSTPPEGGSANDHFADAWEIDSFPYVIEQNTAGMTTEPGEPLNPDGCIIAEPPVMGATVWYEFTPSVSARLTADTVGSMLDTVLAAYTGDAVDALTLLVCSDDDPDLGLRSRITLQVSAGTAYHFQVGGFAGGSGQLRFNVSVGASAPPTPTSAPPPFGVAGDATCDGLVNALDAIFVLQVDAGYAISLPCRENADANRDGSINALDAMLILQYDAGLLDALPP